MESDLPPSWTPRKVKFAPKGPPRRKAKIPEPKTEVANDDEDDDEINEALLRKANEHLTRRRPKAEKRSSVEVAFDHGVASSTSIRTYGIPKEGTDERTGSVWSKDSTSDNQQDFPSLPSASRTDRIVENTENVLDSLTKQKKREYKEPWDYHHSYYPVSLPLRRPYSGDPELLNEEEIEEATAALEYDENVIHSASDLGLLEQGDEAKLFFLQLPAKLPLGRRQASTNALSKVGSLEEFPTGYIGKMFVYKSGAVKLKLGDILYDVSPGSNCIFAQDVMAVNTVEEHCCALGELSKRAVVTPDIDSLLERL